MLFCYFHDFFLKLDYIKILQSDLALILTIFCPVATRFYSPLQAFTRLLQTICSKTKDAQTED